jgi:hypothetical protein
MLKPMLLSQHDVAEAFSEDAVCVAVIDGPVDLTHSCFAGSTIEIVGELSAQPRRADPATTHGTAIASIIFGQPGSPVEGIAPQAHGLVIPIFSTSSDGVVHPVPQDMLAGAIDMAVARGADIINISAGQFEPSGTSELVLAEAAQRAREAGVIILAAAGNDGCDCLHVPAALPDVIAVGALDRAGMPLGISNWGEGYRGHAVMAPGEAIPTASLPDGIEPRTGTSFASAIASGTAALLLSEFRKRAIPDAANWVRAGLTSAVEPGAQPLTGEPQRWIGARLTMSAITSLTSTKRNQTMSDTVETSPAKEGTTTQQRPVTAEVPPRSVVAETAERPVTGIIPANASDAVGGGGCACNTNPTQLAYVLGELSYDFASEARRDGYLQHSNTNVNDVNALIALLDRDLSAATGITWTLNIELTPIYAIQPSGPFASETYRKLVEFLKEQAGTRAERVSLPGYVGGSATLMSGITVPILVPELRGMYSWTTSALVQAVLGARPSAAAEQRTYAARGQELQNFLERVYFDTRNHGLSSQERAINYAATNAFQSEQVFRSAMGADLKLDAIDVERSPLGRPGSDCWDVKLTFFNPSRRLDQARQVYRFTIDVSDVIPVTIGRIRSWQVY